MSSTESASQKAAIGPLPMPVSSYSVPKARTVVLIRSVPSCIAEANAALPTTAPPILIVRKDLPAHDLHEFIDRALRLA